MLCLCRWPLAINAAALPPGIRMLWCVHESYLNEIFLVYVSGWPAPCICIVYDRILSDFPAKIAYIYTPYVYGSGQPYVGAFSLA